MPPLDEFIFGNGPVGVLVECNNGVDVVLRKKQRGADLLVNVLKLERAQSGIVGASDEREKKTKSKRGKSPEVHSVQINEAGAKLKRRTEFI